MSILSVDKRNKLLAVDTTAEEFVGLLKAEFVGCVDFEQRFDVAYKIRMELNIDFDIRNQKYVEKKIMYVLKALTLRKVSSVWDCARSMSSVFNEPAPICSRGAGLEASQDVDWDNERFEEVHEVLTAEIMGERGVLAPDIKNLEKNNELSRNYW
jgi:hypothetical protein